jgi:hypothetical protein
LPLLILDQNDHGGKPAILGFPSLSGLLRTAHDGYRKFESCQPCRSRLLPKRPSRPRPTCRAVPPPYDILKGIAREGVGIVMITSELPELILHASRVLVMRHGMIVGEMAGAEISEEAVLACALAS